MGSNLTFTPVTGKESKHAITTLSKMDGDLPDVCIRTIKQTIAGYWFLFKETLVSLSKMLKIQWMWKANTYY